MSGTKEIDHRIEQLKQKKKQIENAQALSLYKNMEQIMKDEFAPDLVRVMVHEAWAKATTQQKEIWHNNASSFRKPSRAKTEHKIKES